MLRAFAASLIAIALLLAPQASRTQTTGDGAAPTSPAAGDDAPLPRFAPVEPDAAEATFRTLAGFRMELLAAEPDVADPVAGAYDADGRLYVVEMADYPHVEAENDRPFTDNTGDPPLGRVRLLIDADGDGDFDASHLFAEGLSWPTGVAPWKGGIFVAATPDIWYLEDTDGDHRADVRTRVFTGFRKYNVQAVMNNLIWGLDHWIYGAASGNGGQVVPAEDPDAAPVPVLRRDFRFDPVADTFEAISGGARFGNTFDDYGNRFLCNIRNPAVHVVLLARYLARNPSLPAPSPLHDAAPAGDTIPMHRISPPEPWRALRADRWTAIGKALPRSELVGAGYLTSSSGVTSYRGDAYPAGFRGNLFLGEVANNLIHRMSVAPDGVTFRADKADPGPVEFVASTDTWFRPVNFINAPDGTLHVLDMYRETIEHPWSIPDDIRERLDLRSGADRGRIYRLAPPGFAPRPAPQLSRAGTAELVALLEHPNAWHRETAHRLIYGRQDTDAVAPLRSLLRGSRSPLGRLHALWSLEGLTGLSGPEGEQDLLGALADADPGVREHAVRLAEPHLAGSPRLRERLRDLAGDDNIRVRFQVAFTLGEWDDPQAVAALARIARRDAADPWVRTAVLSAAVRRPVALYEALVDGVDGTGSLAASPEARPLLRDLAFTIGARGKPDEALATLGLIARCPLPGPSGDAVRLDLTLPLAEGFHRAGLPLDGLPLDGPGHGEIPDMLEALARYADARVGDASAPIEDRVRAIALFAHRPLAEAREALAPRLEPGEPQEIQLAAARALAEHPEAGVATVLIGPWRGYTPAVRAEVLQILLGRAIWHPALLDAVEAGTISPGQIPAARRSSLLASKDAAVRRRAETLLGTAPSAPRAEIIDRYGAALARQRDTADPERGRAVFERECSTCHALGDTGHTVGPNLASVQHRTPEEILVHVLDPNREVAPDFLEYTVALDDGRVVAGLIEAESASSLTLKRAGGETDTVLRDHIEEITTSGRSLMPDGLEDKIPPGEMADLIAYLLRLQAL